MGLRPLLVFLLLASACAMPSGDAVRDLAAIHDPVDWTPRSPAALSVAPGAYMGNMGDRISGAGLYEIHDHRQLELALLDSIAATEPDREGPTLEASAWLLTLLLADDHAAARVRSAKTLSSWCGHWVSRMEARLPVDPQGSLEEAVRMLDEVEEREEFEAALLALNQAALPDAWTAVRVLTGLARTAPRWSTIEERNPAVFAFSLRVVLLGLQTAAKDADPEVAAVCKERAGLVRDYASRP